MGTAAKVVAYGWLARDFHAFLLTLKFPVAGGPRRAGADARAVTDAGGDSVALGAHSPCSARTRRIWPQW